MIRFPGRRHRAEISRALDLAGLGTMAREPVRYLDEPGRVRVAIAVALMVGKAHVIVREPLTGLKPADAAGIAVELKRLAEISRHCVVTSGERAELLVDAADRVLALDDGLLVYDGPPRPFAERRVYSRLIS